MQSTEYSISSTTDLITNSTFNQSLTESSIHINDTYILTTEKYYNIVTSSLLDTLSTLTTLSIHHHDHTTIHSEFACVRSELSEPDFQLYACSGSKITSWIASIFLVTMSIFGIISKYFYYLISNYKVIFNRFVYCHSIMIRFYMI